MIVKGDVNWKTSLSGLIGLVLFLLAKSGFIDTGIIKYTIEGLSGLIPFIGLFFSADAKKEKTK